MNLGKTCSSSDVITHVRLQGTQLASCLAELMTNGPQQANNHPAHGEDTGRPIAGHTQDRLTAPRRLAVCAEAQGGQGVTLLRPCGWQPG